MTNILKRIFCRIVNIIIKTDFVKLPTESPYLLDETVFNAGYHSFGNKNADKKFYVIWRRNYGSGFFSNYSLVLAHTIKALEMGCIPVVDFKNFKTLYNKDYENENAWESYFEKLSPYSLDLVYESKNVYFCDGGFPKGFSFNIPLIDPKRKYLNLFKINDYVQSFINESTKIDDTYVGTHLRAQEQNQAPGHWFGATYKQVERELNKIPKKYNSSKVFIVSEEQDAINYFYSKFGENLFFTNSFRSTKSNSYNMQNIRENHRHKLGLEVLRDAILLSKCKGLIYVSSNVSEYSKYINNNQYSFECRIDNGPNSHDQCFAKILFKVKKKLPYRFGGLANIIKLTER